MPVAIFRTEKAGSLMASASIWEVTDSSNLSSTNYSSATDAIVSGMLRKLLKSPKSEEN